MLRNAYFILSFFVIFFFLPPTAFATASINLQSNTSTLASVDDTYEVNATVTLNATDGTIYYLRGVFYKQNTSSYCGYTWNGNDWFSGPYSTNEGWKNFLPITITDGSWSGVLRAKVDASDNACSTSGDYQFKIERFTAGGSGNFDDQNIQMLSIIIPTVTPTPTTIPTPTRTPTPTKVPTPTKMPTPTKVQTDIPTTAKVATTIVPTRSVSLGQVNIPLSPATESAYPTAVLGASSSARPTPKQAHIQTMVKDSINTPLRASIFIIAAVFFIACGILVFYRIKKQES